MCSDFIKTWAGSQAISFAKTPKSVRNFVDQCTTWQSRPNHFDASFFFPFKFLPRPHVTRENAVSCQITFKLYRFFSQFVANSSKASLSCYIYCDLWQLMVILRIVYIIYCDFAIVCAICCHLWQFCNNFKFFS